MYRMRPVLTLSMLALAASPAAIHAQQRPAQVLIERARMLDAQGRHDRAVENWHQVLLLEPRQPDGLAALATYYRSTGDKARAEYYRQLLGTVRPEEAARQASSEAGFTPSGTNDPRLAQAAHLSATHQYTEALSLFRQVFGATPPDNWAVAYYQSEAAVPSENSHGLAGLRALAAKYPANPAYQLALARVLTYQPATRLEGVRLLSGFRGSAAENEQARAAWRAAILWDTTAPAAVETATLYLQRYPDAALSARLQQQKVSTVARISPSEAAGYRELSSGNVSEAATHFSALAEESGQAARGEAGLGYVSMKRKEFPDAVRHFEAARAKGMRSPALDKALQEARYWGAMSSGNEALVARDPTLAASEFARAREVDAHRPEATEALAGSMMAAQDPQQAEAVFAMDAKSNPGRPDAWLGWMNALLEAGQPDRLLALQPKIPNPVRAQLTHRADYLAMLLCAELAQGNAEDSRMLLDRIAKVESESASASGSASGLGADDPSVRAASLLFRHSFFDQASRLCMAALKHDSNNAEGWQILVQSEHMAGRDRSAIAIAGRMPRSVDAAAMANPGFLLALASIYQGDGQLASAKVLLERAQQIAGADQQTKTSLTMQKASLALAQGDTRLAHQLYQEVTEQTPEQLDAWTGMFSALHAGNHDAEALAAMHELPEAVSSRLRHDAAFLETAAYVYSGTGHTREARLCLNAVTDHYQQQHQPVPFGASIELAWLQLNAGEQRPLAATLDRLSKQPTLSIAQSVAIQQVWVAWSTRRAEAAFAAGDAKQAVDLLEVAAQAYPSDLTLRSQLAAMYVRAGHAAQGMKLYQALDWSHAKPDQFASAIGAALTAHSMSYAEYWLHLGLEQYPANAELLRAGAHVEESKGNLKAAENYLRLAVGTEGGEGTAGSVLTSAHVDADALPRGTETAAAAPESALARLLAGSDGPGGSAATDSTSERSSSSLAAPASRKSASRKSAVTPVPEATPPAENQDDADQQTSQPAPMHDKQQPAPDAKSTAFFHPSAYTPDDDEPRLVLAGTSKKAARRALIPSTSEGSQDGDSISDGADGSTSPAAHTSHTRSLKIASGSPAVDSSREIADPLHGLDLGLDPDTAPSPGTQAGSRDQMRSMSMIGRTEDDAPATLSALLESADQVSADHENAAGATPGNADGSASDARAITLEAALLGGVRPGSATGPGAGVMAIRAESPSRLVPSADPAMVRRAAAPTPSASEELADLRARYSPWLGAGGAIETHSGTPGFDHLEHYEAEMAASTVLGGGSARLSIITRPVLLQSGVPDATSNYRFGSSAALPQDSQFASGTGASLQLATRNLQASVGFSPSGFLINNVLGSLAYRPLGGAFTLSAYRASQKDSMLSYAGLKDPGTGEVWGGVVATGGSLQFAHGGATSGYYASVDGQKLTGTHVTDNMRVLGNAGAYWLAYSNPYGDLKVGVNLTAMHYALNERYFTLGQGGYFSPDAFLLMNAPVTWQARPIHNTTYAISGSLGAQSIQQAAAMSGSLVLGTGVETTTGTSYDLHLKVAHRMDAHWTLEGFYDTNNARSYTDNSTGFTVRYSQFPQSAESAPTGFLNLADPLPLLAP